jgi:dihydrofolate synthase/folylpolyglutamate synthase
MQRNYDEAVAYLYGLGNEVEAMKLGLVTVSRLLARLDEPHRRFASAIVAGTNGKGSVAAMLDAIARRAGLRTGLYTSPHLVEIVERIRVDGEAVSRERFAAHASRVREAAESLVDEGALGVVPTFFEQVTAIAFLEFAERRVDLAVLEVGMGGRLDATNVVDPLVAAVTPVALDHQRYLGGTLAEIAAEKAAVIKPGAAAVVAHQPPEALEPIIERCLATDVLPRFVGEAEIHHSENGRFTFSYETETARYDRITLGLRGRHQIENALVAIHAAEALRAANVEITRGAILDGLAEVQWPGRLELHLGAPPILLDGAHNVAGAHALRAYVDEFCHCPVTLVFAVMEDKDAEAIARELFPAMRAVVVTRPSNARAADPAKLAERLAERLADLLPNDGGRPFVAATLDEALTWARRVTPRDGLICVAGSLYLVGETKALLARKTPSAPTGGRS